MLMTRPADDSPDARLKLMKGLKSKLQRLANTTKSTPKSNKGGWQWAGQNLLGEESGFLVAQKLFEHAVVHYMQINLETGTAKVECLSSWGNVNPKGGYNSVHTHPGASLAGVLYVACPKESRGNIEFHDPRPGSSMIRNTRFARQLEYGTPKKFRMEEGDVAIFPPFVDHGVEPNLSDELRISISANFIVDYKPGDNPIK